MGASAKQVTEAVVQGQLGLFSLEWLMANPIWGDFHKTVWEKVLFSHYNQTLMRHLGNREVKKIGCLWRRVGYLSLSCE